MIKVLLKAGDLLGDLEQGQCLDNGLKLGGLKPCERSQFSTAENGVDWRVFCEHSKGFKH